MLQRFALTPPYPYTTCRCRIQDLGFEEGCRPYMIMGNCAHLALRLASHLFLFGDVLLLRLK